MLFLIPLTPLPVVQALWLIFFGAMLLEFGSRPLPEAWTVARGAAVAGPPPRERAGAPARGEPRGAAPPAAARPPLRSLARRQEAQAPPLSRRDAGIAHRGGACDRRSDGSSRHRKAASRRSR